MAVKLSFDEQKWLLKCYWKVENVVEVQRRWRVEFDTLPSTRLIIIRIRDKFEVDGTVEDVLKCRCGWKRSSTDNESAEANHAGFCTIPKEVIEAMFSRDWYGEICRLHDNKSSSPWYKLCMNFNDSICYKPLLLNIYYKNVQCLI